MKQIIFTFFFLSAITLVSCRKKGVEPNIIQYDDAQIQNYIKVNGLTGFTKATDTSGIYYKIIVPGSGTALDYPDKVSFVFSLKSFDGRYTSPDTLANHFRDYLGHVTNAGLPVGLALAIHNTVKYRGASVRLLIPSHLAYGVNGFGTGSNQNLNTKIAGNQCLDYYIHIIGNTKSNNQSTYDDLVIQNYIKANGLSGYTKVLSSVRGVVDADTIHYNNYYYYQILTPATNTTDPINGLSTITATYTGLLLNGYVFDGGNNGARFATVNIADLIPGVAEPLQKFAFAGTKISIIMPSTLGYGEIPQTGITTNSCLRFTWQIITVTP